jgi:hypothetical protein
MFIGFSTGCLYKNIEPISVEAVNAIKSTHCNAIELCAGLRHRIYQLDSISNSDLENFDYISLHAPDDVVYDNSVGTKMVLDEIVRQHKRLDFDLIVVHGHNIVCKDVFKKYNLPIAIENHDKFFGRGVEEMESIFKKFDTDMVLDVLHSYLVGKSSKLTNSLYSRFKDRIVQIHLSGLGKHDDSQQHYPINETRQEDILDSVPKYVPIIIESVFPNYSDNEKLLNELKVEYSYIKNHMTKKE